MHLAWGIPEDPRRGTKTRLRRITYELAPIGPATRRSTTKDGKPVREPL
ncbi:hypothetical protein ACIRD2_32245 [Streptomyces sp. NPDC093595]